MRSVFRVFRKLATFSSSADIAQQSSRNNIPALRDFSKSEAGSSYFGSFLVTGVHKSERSKRITAEVTDGKSHALLRCFEEAYASVAPRLREGAVFHFPSFYCKRPGQEFYLGKFLPLDDAVEDVEIEPPSRTFTSLAEAFDRFAQRGHRDAAGIFCHFKGIITHVAPPKRVQSGATTLHRFSFVDAASDYGMDMSVFTEAQQPKPDGVVSGEPVMLLHTQLVASDRFFNARPTFVKRVDDEADAARIREWYAEEYDPTRTAQLKYLPLASFPAAQSLADLARGQVGAIARVTVKPVGMHVHSYLACPGCGRALRYNRCEPCDVESEGRPEFVATWRDGTTAAQGHDVIEMSMFSQDVPTTTAYRNLDFMSRRIGGEELICGIENEPVEVVVMKPAADYQPFGGVTKLRVLDLQHFGEFSTQ